MTTYSTASNARKAARKLGLNLADLSFVEDDAGRWGWVEAGAVADEVPARDIHEDVAVDETIGAMTAEQRNAIATEACAKLEAEFARPEVQAAFQRILGDAEPAAPASEADLAEPTGTPILTLMGEAAREAAQWAANRYGFEMALHDSTGAVIERVQPAATAVKAAKPRAKVADAEPAGNAAIIIQLCSTETGASVDELAAALKWVRQSPWAYEVKKVGDRFGLSFSKAKVDGVTRYRLA